MLLTIALLMASCDCLLGPREPRGRNRFWVERMVAATFNAGLYGGMYRSLVLDCLGQVQLWNAWLNAACDLRSDFWCAFSEDTFGTTR